MIQGVDHLHGQYEVTVVPGEEETPGDCFGTWLFRNYVIWNLGDRYSEPGVKASMNRKANVGKRLPYTFDL